MALQFKGGPFAGSYTTNTFNTGKAQPMPPPSRGTPYGQQPSRITDMQYRGNIPIPKGAPQSVVDYMTKNPDKWTRGPSTRRPQAPQVAAGGDPFTFAQPQVTPYQPFVNQQGQQFQDTISFAPGTSQAYQNQAYGNYANEQGYYQPQSPASSPTAPQTYNGKPVVYQKGVPGVITIGTAGAPGNKGYGTLGGYVFTPLPQQSPAGRAQPIAPPLQGTPYGQQIPRPSREVMSSPAAEAEYYKKQKAALPQQDQPPPQGTPYQPTPSQGASAPPHGSDRAFDDFHLKQVQASGPRDLMYRPEADLWEREMNYQKYLQQGGNRIAPPSGWKPEEPLRYQPPQQGQPPSQGTPRGGKRSLREIAGDFYDPDPGGAKLMVIQNWYNPQTGESFGGTGVAPRPGTGWVPGVSPQEQLSRAEIIRSGGTAQQPQQPAYKPPPNGFNRPDPSTGKRVTYKDGQWTWEPNPTSGPQPYDTSRFGDGTPAGPGGSLPRAGQAQPIQPPSQGTPYGQPADPYAVNDLKSLPFYKSLRVGDKVRKRESGQYDVYDSSGVAVETYNPGRTEPSVSMKRAREPLFLHQNEGMTSQQLGDIQLQREKDAKQKAAGDAWIKGAPARLEKEREVRRNSPTGKQAQARIDQMQAEVANLERNLSKGSLSDKNAKLKRIRELKGQISNTAASFL